MLFNRIHYLLPLVTLSPLVASIPTNPSKPKTCGTIIPPSNFYQIYEDPEFINQTSGLGPFYPSGEFSFATSQEANNVNERDLIASFKNVPCPPGGKDPYRLEFNFVPDGRYTASGLTRIDVFPINGDLPSIVFPDGSSSEIPTWTTTNQQTGSIIGTFVLPTGTAAQKASLISIKTLGCKPTINLRFSITNGRTSAGSVNYFSKPPVGLRIRYGC
ncbi:MAG: hypothetical protein Q9219_007713 [cf. Caloplaca sp. 3 TL-2023]